MKKCKETKTDLNTNDIKSLHNLPTEPLQFSIYESIIPPNNIGNQVIKNEIKVVNANFILNSSDLVQDTKNEDNSLVNQTKSSPKKTKTQTKNGPHSNSRIHWTEEENKQLKNLVKQYGAKKWNTIGSILKTKTGKQCRDHYMNVLDPDIKNTLWTVEEEKTLLQKYHQLGPHWSQIKNFLPGRTTGMIKNYIQMLMKRNGDKFFKVPQNDDYEFNPNSNSFSENDASFDFESKETETRQNEFSIHDIAFLLNRPSDFNDPQ
ncbi:hypothetical protein M9Y10_003666 [Tritrichomonas musculus]|uniref:Myb-like DNA-binding domain containing protein n=1 Tax=Tritrichomonas musculus TaxID=1915356 RepID=A0ABR2JQC7_9EUKA